MAELPRYPIFIPSKGRAENCHTALCLSRDEVPFRLVVEPQEEAAYTEKFGAARVVALPFRDLGSVIPARNWIKDRAAAEGFDRHWQIDDNITYFGRRYRGRRIRCDAGIALRASEDYVERYENIAVAGLNYYMFATDRAKLPAVQINCHVYSCTLTLNSLPYKWRGRYNEDTDYCLQVLSGGWCTALINVFLVQKLATMTVKGGNAAELYKGDGRLKMARSLERLWPGVVTTDRRFKRPQHVVKNSWKQFDTPLKLKPGIDLAALAPNEYGLKLTQVADEIRSPRIRKLFEEARGD